ncbi:MAG: 16S rRNA (adenine(1518)-N(6)/adenine(1519)-N(6))-dimethyltransferase RsmA [candidate division WOR-3 bacterium]
MRHLRPRKALGQSFLTYEPTAEALVAALGIEPGDTVLEIGPGKGILTRRLVQQAGRVIAVEIDQRLVEGLRQELAGWHNLEVVHGDFMEYDLRQHQSIKVIGNLPYYLSSQMLFRLIDFITSWQRAVLTTQREFAQRVLGTPRTKAYGALTVFCDRLVEKRKLLTIPAWQFKPRPEVVSVSFLLIRRPKPLFELTDEELELFKRVVRAGFGQRRKMLVNNLSQEFGLSKEKTIQLMRRAGIPPEARAEMLTAEMFYALTQVLAQAASSS